MDLGTGAVQSGNRIGLVSERGFLAAGAVLFVAAAALTVYWAMPMTGNSPMPVGGNASMPGMAMSDQTWLAAAAFMGMWVVMMAAMMLPSLLPTLVRYRSSLRQSGRVDLAGSTALAGGGYFLVWAVFGAAVYVLWFAVAAAQMLWMGLAGLLPAATGAAVLLAGIYQLTPWKTRQLACCRVSWEPNSGAWWYGLRLGAHCTLCCLGLMVPWLAAGTMNLGAMVLVTGAITLERLGPRPVLIARALGLAGIAAGLIMTARAFGLV